MLNIINIKKKNRQRPDGGLMFKFPVRSFLSMETYFRTIFFNSYNTSNTFFRWVFHGNDILAQQLFGISSPPVHF